MSIIIECRNKTADIKHRDGDWETLLGENITINPNDQLYVKNSFIDTQLSTNEKINVKDELELVIKYGYYNILNNATGLKKYDATGDDPTLTYLPITLAVIYEIPTPDPNNIKLITDGTAISADGINPMKSATVKLSFTDFNGDPKERNIFIPGGNDASFKFDLPDLRNILYRNDSATFSPDTATLKREFNINLTVDVEVLEGKNVAVPVVQETKIIIPEGTYDPDNLCEIINERMTQNTQGDEFPFNGTSILTSVGYLQNIVYGAPAAPTQKLVFVPTDGNDNLVIPRVTSEYHIPPNNDIFTGASQFELAFDQNTKKFEFAFMHTPFYYQTHPAVQIYKDTNIASLPVYRVGNQSGIFLQGLSAVEKVTQKPSNFWSLLGFDFSQTPDLIPVFNYKEIDDAQDPGKKILIPEHLFTFGNDITQGLITTDTAIVKDNPLVPFADNPINSTATVNDTTAIKAGISVLDNEDKFGYFIVEIGHKLKNDFYTQENNYRNFQQVVSRYFVQNSYTSGTSDGSLIYTHEGEPTLLQSFRCRILNSDKELANNIGEDNTVHLVLIRAPQPAPALPAPKKEKKEEDEK